MVCAKRGAGQRGWWWALLLVAVVLSCQCVVHVAAQVELSAGTKCLNSNDKVQYKGERLTPTPAKEELRSWDSEDKVNKILAMQKKKKCIEQAKGS